MMPIFKFAFPKLLLVVLSLKSTISVYLPCSIIGDDEDALYILSKALSHQCVIPDFPSFVSETKLIFEAVALDRSGEVSCQHKI